MNRDLNGIVPMLLRPIEDLTEAEVDLIKGLYVRYGRDEFEMTVRQEKSIRPFASLLLSQVGCDAEYWAGVHGEYVVRSGKIVEILKPLFRDYFGQGGKSLCVVENFGSMLSSGISVGCFASNDVDVTADADEKGFLCDVFARNGFTMDRRGEHPVDNAQITTFHNAEVMDGRGYWINVMWQTTSRSSFVRQELYDRRLATERAYAEKYGDTEIRLLRPTAMVYFCALHIALEHFFTASPGMPLYCDVDRVARYRDVNWKEIKEWSREDRSGLRIDMVMDICRELLNTPIPNGFTRSRSVVYKVLRRYLTGGGEIGFNPLMGKWRRLFVEIMSDDVPVVWNGVRRLWIDK